MSHPVDEILRRHGLRGPWTALPSPGLAKRVYVTADIVVGIATDHPDAVADALTESVAAPVAHAAGVRTPRLLAFDRTCTLIERPYSVWERVHGQPLRRFAADPRDVADTWRRVGRELAFLHANVHECHDPHNWLDVPAIADDPRPFLPDLVDSGRLSAGQATWLDEWVERLAPLRLRKARRRFLHGDAHGMNVMCDERGEFAALIDWGDAGWGDPALDLASIPVGAWELALEGYEQHAPGLLGDGFEPVILWERIEWAIAHLAEPTARTGRWDELVRIAREPTSRLAPWCLAPP